MPCEAVGVYANVNSCGFVVVNVRCDIEVAAVDKVEAVHVAEILVSSVSSVSHEGCKGIVEVRGRTSDGRERCVTMLKCGARHVSLRVVSAVEMEHIEVHCRQSYA